MKLAFTIAFFLLCTAAVWPHEKTQEINSVLHDRSYLLSFGKLPGAQTNEQLRIQTHLSYVDELLRSAATGNLTSSQKANRELILELLTNYRSQGVFPVNSAYPGERKPCFIDDIGNICAVGYLIEQTKGREMAEDINAKHQYDFLLEMNEPAINQWAAEFGLTPEECAMIQPTYGYQPPEETRYADIKTGYGVSSAVVGGANIAISALNLSGKLAQHPRLSYLGLITGTGQLVFGIANVKKNSSWSRVNGGEYTVSYKSQNNLSYANILVGSTTLISSAVNLMIYKKNKDRRNTFNMYGQPGYNNSLAVGLSFSRKI